MSERDGPDLSSAAGPATSEANPRAARTGTEPAPTEPRRPMPLLGPAIGLAALLAALLFTFDALHRWDRLQTCVTAGRRDCDR